MLAKCSNPSCFTSFRYLNKGALFCLETDPPAGEKSGPTQYFWLCERCSATMTSTLTENQIVVAIPLPERTRRVYSGISLMSSDRKKRLLLRSISLLSEPSGDR